MPGSAVIPRLDLKERRSSVPTIISRYQGALGGRRRRPMALSPTIDHSRSFIIGRRLGSWQSSPSPAGALTDSSRSLARARGRGTTALTTGNLQALNSLCNQRASGVATKTSTSICLVGRFVRAESALQATERCSPFQYGSRRTFLEIFPVPVSGISVTKSIVLGTL